LKKIFFMFENEIFIDYYDVSNVCTLCHYSCKTCSNGNTNSNCQTCDTIMHRGTSPVLGVCACQDGNKNENWIKLKIYFIYKIKGYFDNSVSLCAACHQRCKTCSTSATMCLTCDNSLFRTGPSSNTCDCIEGKILLLGKFVIYN
jgi:hypothetical protein